MSEASTPKTPEEQTAGEAVTPNPAPSPVKPSRNGAATGLAAFALLIGLAGVAAGGWSLWQLQDMQRRDQQLRNPLTYCE